MRATFHLFQVMGLISSYIIHLILKVAIVATLPSQGIMLGLISTVVVPSDKFFSHHDVNICGKNAAFMVNWLILAVLNNCIKQRVLHIMLTCVQPSAFGLAYSIIYMFIYLEGTAGS